MNGTCMKCDGCGVEVRVSTSGPHAVAPDLATARAFGWEVPASSGEPAGQHVCPVCIEARDVAQQLVAQAQAQSSLILPDHVQQQRQKQKPVPKHKLFAVPNAPRESDEQKHQRMLETLSRHANGALAVVRDYFQPPQGLRWNPNDGSPWRIIISREEEEQAPMLPRARG